MNSFKPSIVFFIGLITIFISCKNEPKNIASPEVATPKTLDITGDISSIEVLDHNFKITPEGSKLFLKGFFVNKLVDAAITVNTGELRVQKGIITKGVLNLDIKTISMIAERDENIETFMRGDKAFNSGKYATGSFVIEECTKAVNDQQASHILKGKLNIHDHSVPFTVRARVDYKSKFITITTDQIVIKAPELGIKMADPSQNNIYFSLTLSADIQ